jgi:hypothetical protein
MLKYPGVWFSGNPASEIFREKERVHQDTLLNQRITRYVQPSPDSFLREHFLSMIKVESNHNI